MNTDKVDELYDRVKKAGANIFLPIEEKCVFLIRLWQFSVALLELC